MTRQDSLVFLNQILMSFCFKWDGLKGEKGNHHGE